MGPVSVPMERSALPWMARQAGLPGGGRRRPHLRGVGGEPHRAPRRPAGRAPAATCGTRGSQGGPPLAILASDETHYSSGARRSSWARARGRRPRSGRRAVPAPAGGAARGALPRPSGRDGKSSPWWPAPGSTSTGAFDPLEPVADFCGERGLWFHVDGAHGAAAVLSPQYAHLARGHRPRRLAGLGRAQDDAPPGAGHRGALPRRAPLLRGLRAARRLPPAPGGPGRVVEPGAPHAGVHQADDGPRALRTPWPSTARGCSPTTSPGCSTSAGASPDGATTPDDFELAVEPDCNIVCFRLRRRRTARTSTGTRSASGARLLRRGQLLPGADPRSAGTCYLRVTLINPLTTEADLEALLAAIRRRRMNTRAEFAAETSPGDRSQPGVRVPDACERAVPTLGRAARAGAPGPGTPPPGDGHPGPVRRRDSAARSAHFRRSPPDGLGRCKLAGPCRADLRSSSPPPTSPRPGTATPNSDEQMAPSRAIGRTAGLRRIGLHLLRAPAGHPAPPGPTPSPSEEEFAFVVSGEVDAWIDGELHPDEGRRPRRVPVRHGHLPHLPQRRRAGGACSSSEARRTRRRTASSTR